MNSNNRNLDSNYFYQQTRPHGQGENVTDNEASWNRLQQSYPLNPTRQSYNMDFTYQDGSFPIGLEEMTPINHEAYATNQIQQPRINTNLSYPQDICLESGDQFEYIVQPTLCEQAEFSGMTTLLPHQNWNPPMYQQRFDEQLQNYLDIPPNRNEVPGQQFDSGSSTMNVSETLWGAYDSATDIYEPNSAQGPSESWAESAGGLNQIQEGYCQTPSQSFDMNFPICPIPEHQFPDMYHETNAPNKMHPHPINYNYNFHPSTYQQTPNEYYQGCGNSVQPETFQQQSGFMHQPTYASQSENLPMPQQLQTLCQTGGPSAASHYAFQTPEQEFPSSHPNVFPNAQPLSNNQPQVSDLPHVNIPKGQTIQPELRGTTFDYDNQLVDEKSVEMELNSASTISRAERGGPQPNEVTRLVQLQFGKFQSRVVNLDRKDLQDEVLKDLSLQAMTIKSLEISCNGFCPSTQSYFLLVLGCCPLIDTLKLSFLNFCAEPYSIRSYNSNLKSFTSEKINFSCLQNLSTIELNSTSRRPPARIHKDQVGFFAEIYKEIIKSSGNLKKLGLTASQAPEFLRLIKADSETGVKLNHLRTFRLQTYLQSGDERKIHDSMNSVFDFLTQVSSSLQVLQIYGVTWKNLGDFPLLSNLRILCIQFEMDYSHVTLSTQSFPQLQTLIVRYYNRYKELNFNFGWPFDDEGGLKLNEERDFSHSFSPQLVNVVLYPTWTFLYWFTGIRHFFNSIRTVNVDSLFIDLTYNKPSYGAQFECKSTRLALAKHLRSHPVSWNRCLLRFRHDKEGSAVVFDILSEE